MAALLQKVSMHSEALHNSFYRSSLWKFCYQGFITQDRMEWVTEFMQPSRTPVPLSLAVLLASSGAGSVFRAPRGADVITEVLWWLRSCDVFMLCAAVWSCARNTRPSCNPAVPRVPSVITWTATHTVWNSITPYTNTLLMRGLLADSY